MGLTYSRLYQNGARVRYPYTIRNRLGKEVTHFWRGDQQRRYERAEKLHFDKISRIGRENVERWHRGEELIRIPGGTPFIIVA